MNTSEKPTSIEDRLIALERRKDLEAAHAELAGRVDTALATAVNQWHLARFNQGETDLRWAKEQSMKVAQSSMALSVGILAASSLTSLPKSWFIGATLLQGILAIAWLISLHNFAKKTREEVNGFLASIGVAETKLAKDNHELLLAAFLVFVAAAALLVVVALAP